MVEASASPRLPSLKSVTRPLRFNPAHARLADRSAEGAKVGAGEGNRTLVISLEGVRAFGAFNAFSDKNRLSGPFEPKREFAAVRTLARCADLTAATATFALAIIATTDITFSRPVTRKSRRAFIRAGLIAIPIVITLTARQSPMPNTLTCAVPSSRGRNRQHFSAPTAPSVLSGRTDAIVAQQGCPALDGQPTRLACDRCGTLFYPRRGSGGSKQRFCSDECRKISNRERQRTQRRGSYAGPTTLPATGQSTQNEMPAREPAMAPLRPWETRVLDIADCERTEFVVALNNGEAAGTRIETWPLEVRAFMDQHVNRWVEENKETRMVEAMTVAAPKHDGIQSCVVILHHFPRE